MGRAPYKSTKEGGGRFSSIPTFNKSATNTWTNNNGASSSLEVKSYIMAYNSLNVTNHGVAYGDHRICYVGLCKAAFNTMLLASDMHGTCGCASQTQ